MKEKLKNIILGVLILGICVTIFFYNYNKEDIAPGSITLYRVENNKIIKKEDYPVKSINLKYQKDIKKHQEIWKELVSKIVVPPYKKYLKEFLIFNGEAEDSDAFVTPISNDLKDWQVAIAIDYNSKENDKSLEFIIIHELGHIVALNSTQIDSSISTNVCNTYNPEEGCSKIDSYINKFYNKFWLNLKKEYDDGKNKSFYKNNNDKFLTDYAATDPLEDFSEAFAYFITEDFSKRKIEKEKDLKVKFFYDYPELIELRKKIRKNIFK